MPLIGNHRAEDWPVGDRDAEAPVFFMRGICICHIRRDVNVSVPGKCQGKPAHQKCHGAASDLSI